MPGYLFPASALLVLLVFCALCGVASAGTANKGAKLFKRKIINVLQPKGDNEERTNVMDFGLPSLVGTSDVMVALVNVRNAYDKRGILTKYIETRSDEWGKRAIEGDDRNWRAQWALKSGKTTHIAFAPVAKNNSVYVLSARKAESAPAFFPQRTTNATMWDFQLTIGTITDGADAAGKRIEWGTQNVSDRFVTDIKEKLQDVYPFDGSALLMEDGTFVFVLRALNFTESKYVFVIAHSRNPNGDFTFTYVNTTANCISSFFPWGKQLFMAPNYCFGDNSSDYKLQVSNDTGKTWGEATGPLAERLSNVTNERGFFTRITIEGRRVLLFTKEESESNDSQGSVNISLFMADENHVERVVFIIGDFTDFFGGSLLYTNDELFFSSVHYRGIKTILLRFKRQLGEIKQLLKTWYPDDI